MRWRQACLVTFVVTSASGGPADRRGFLQAALGTTGLLLVTACGGATATPTPTGAPAKPTEAPSPAPGQAPPAAPAAASPVAVPAPATTASPAAVAPPGASPVASPVAAAATQGATGRQHAGQSRRDQPELSRLGQFHPDHRCLHQGADRGVGETLRGARLGGVRERERHPTEARGLDSERDGPDIVHIRDNWAQTYIQAMTDLSDVVDDLKRTYGDFYPIFEANLRGPDGKWYAMPHDNSGGAMHWRRSWFSDVGATAFPDRLDAYHEIGKRLKAKGRPFGQALGHSFGDAPGWCYGMLWGYGGREVDAQGKVALNSPETIQAVRDMAQAFKDAYDKTGLGWDDSANNRAFLAETISCTQNGSSIWFVARGDRSPFFDDIGLSPIPAGRGARAPGRDRPLASRSTARTSTRRRTAAEPDAARDLRGRASWRTRVHLAGISPKHDQMLPWEKLPRPSRCSAISASMRERLGSRGRRTKSRAGLVEVRGRRHVRAGRPG